VLNRISIVQSQTSDVSPRPSSAGNWIFGNRRWLNPANPYDRARLDAGYDALCAAFPAFAACPRAHFLACIAGVASTHHRPLQGIATGLDCPRELAGPWRAYPDPSESTPPSMRHFHSWHTCVHDVAFLSGRGFACGAEPPAGLDFLHPLDSFGPSSAGRSNQRTGGVTGLSRHGGVGGELPGRTGPGPDFLYPILAVGPPLADSDRLGSNVRTGLPRDGGGGGDEATPSPAADAVRVPHLLNPSESSSAG
jgi:hypothetical protein